MSDADYAPKRRPVLPRLVKALRRIPAVDFAFAKLGALLRRRTNAEQSVAGALVAPVSDGATEVIEADAIERETVATDATHTDTVEAEPALAESIAGGTVETEPTETRPVAIEVVETTEAQSTPDEGDALGADDIASPVAVGESLFDEDSEPVSIEPRPEEPVAIDPIETDTVEIDTIEPAPVEVEAAASESVEACAVAPDAVALPPAATDDAAPPEARSEARDEQAFEPIEANLPIADLAATDPVEIAASETPPTALDAAETAIVDIRAGEDASVETVAIEADDVTSLAASDALPATEAAVAAVPQAKVDEPLDREALIRRRWRETGIMMWRGAGQSTLCIQGSAALLPPKPGETMPQYDRLEFRLIDGLIVCEGFVVDPPAPLKNRTFARAA